MSATTRTTAFTLASIALATTAQAQAPRATTPRLAMRAASQYGSTYRPHVHVAAPAPTHSHVHNHVHVQAPYHSYTPAAVAEQPAPEPVQLAKMTSTKPSRTTETVSPKQTEVLSPRKMWVWLEKQGVWGYGQHIHEGPHAGMWRIDPATKRAPEKPSEPEPTTETAGRAGAPSVANEPAPTHEPAPTYVAASEVTLAADPYGFAAIFNQIRAAAGLPPVAYDPNLSAWASQNNAAQSHRGLGHHVNPNCHQNCAYNTHDANSTAVAWLNSPGHRANLLAPSLSRFGIAFGPGPYWTLNAQ